MGTQVQWHLESGAAAGIDAKADTYGPAGIQLARHNLTCKMGEKELVQSRFGLPPTKATLQ